MINRNLEFFETFLLLERGLGVNSVSAYLTDLRCFADFCRRRCVEHAQEVERDLILDFLGERQENYGDAAATLARKLVSLKLFFRFLEQEKIIEKDPTLIMDSPRLWHYLPDFLSVDEVDRLLAAFPARGKEAHLQRNRAIMELIYASGLLPCFVVTLLPFVDNIINFHNNTVYSLSY